VALMAAGALFKIGAVPLHWWLPDVYSAAAPEVTGFLATSMKAAAVLFLMRIVELAPNAAFATALPGIGALTALVGGGWAIAISKAVAARRLPVSVGPHEIVGKLGIVDEEGLVFVQGELWHAASDSPLKPGQRVQVDALEGLTLRVHHV